MPVSAANGGLVDLGHPTRGDLANVDQLLHRTRHILDRYVRILTVLVVQVDALDPRPLQTFLDRPPHVVPRTVSGQPVIDERDAEPGGDDDVVGYVRPDG
jgi:hypothetical protein